MRRKNKNFILFLVLIFIGINPLRADRIFSKRVCFRGGTITIQSGPTLPARPKIGLVLSGGGSRALVHIGVLKALEENNIPIDLIVGTSMGSMLGGLYASGYDPDALLRIMKHINWQGIYKDAPGRSVLYVGQKAEQDRYLLPIRFDNGNPFIPVAYSPGQRILSILSDLILKAQYQARDNFDNLRIPFRSVATDLVSGKMIALSKGNLAESINASLAVPLLFSPVPLDSMLLVDGGLRANLPVEVARRAGMDIVIAVDVTASLRSKDRLKAPWEIVDQATTIMSDLSKIVQRRQADVLIRPELKGLLNDDFSQSDHLVEIGYRETQKQMDIIRNSIKQDLTQVSVNMPLHRFHFNGIQSLDISQYKHLHMVSDDSISATVAGEDLDVLLSSGQFQNIRLAIDSTGTANVTAKPFSIVKSIQWNGISKLGPASIEQILNTHSGMMLNAFTLKRDLARLVELYRRQGYSLMRIRSINWNEKTGRLQIDIDEGMIDELEIKGNEKTKNYVLLREFSGQKGKVFNRERVRTAIQNIYATQLYERVNTNVISENGKNILVIKVKEKSSVLLRAGGKYDTDRGAQTYLEFGDESIWGTGIKTMLMARFGNRDGNLGIKIRDDRIFFSYFTYDLQAYYSWQENPLERYNGNYREERRGLRFQLGRQVRRIGRLVIELRNENITDNSKNKGFANTQNIELRTFAIRALADRRDRIDFPTKGIYNHWAWETGNRFVFESKESYTKALINLEGYYNFARVHNWHLRMFVGLGDNSMPFSENFRLGGLNSFYGLHQNEYYGRQLVTMNVEYRYQLPWHFSAQNFIFKNTYLSLRYDFGGIWKKPALVFTSDDFFSGFGVNLGIETLFGPLHLSYGQTTRGKSMLYFSLGFNY